MNPLGILLVLFLWPVVKKKWHILLYLIGSYIAYFSVALAVYFGLSRWVISLIEEIRLHYASELRLGRIIFGCCCLISGLVWLTVLCVRLLRHEEIGKWGNKISVRSVKPAFLFFFGMGLTYAYSYACYPLFGFIAVLLNQELSLAAVVILLAVFCSVFAIPFLAIFFLSAFLEGEKFEKIVKKVCRIMTVVCSVCIPVVIIGLGVWGVWVLF